ncbi:MAG: T9SS type A sorting domain-containing protein [Flavobacteriales bacterium]|nr:T9SS type A sorting domain-containing protein [Flavobacteriales bacterium]
MLRSLLPLVFLFAQVAHAQFDSDLLAAADPSEYITCSALESKRATTTEADFAFGQLRLINRSNSVQAYLSGFSQKAGTAYRIMRSVDPELGWEFIAEGVTVSGHDAIAVPDENPLPGRVLYKLETTDAEGKNRILDIRVVNRPLGMDLADIDFMTSPNGSLILSKNDLPETVSQVEIFDLQGGLLKTEHNSFGENIKVNVDHLPFGVYEVVISGRNSAVKKYFLASGNY